MKNHIIALALCLTVLGAHGQTEYRIDQQLNGDIQRVFVASGWNLRLIHDTVNMLSIATPCEYYFTEGNEPEISKQDPDGSIYIWKNQSMPQGTLVELHYRTPLKKLYLYPGASVNADTLLLYDSDISGEYGDVDARREASLSIGHLECNRFTSINADTASTVTIHSIKTRFLMLWSRKDATLMIDSIDARKVDYYRDPTAHDNLWQSDPERNIVVKTSNRWFLHGLKQMNNTIDFAYNLPFNSVRHNSPYATLFDVNAVIWLKTNIVPFHPRWGIAFGMEFGISMQELMNNTTLNGRILDIDTLSAGVNRHQSMHYAYFSIPLQLHYIPQGKFFKDVHLGLSPRVNFLQRYIHGTLDADNHWDTGIDRVKVYRPVQLRADLGWRFRYFSSIEFNFYFDLLPTYRKATGMGNLRTFGFQIRF